ncbi:MAG: M55 family metallopeptidase, partial [Limisphaerales bacterium]
VLLVTGDDATCHEATELLGKNLTTVAVKKSLSRFSARNIPPVRARQMIEKGAEEALKNLKAIKPYRPKAPTKITVDLSFVDKADYFRGRPGVEIIEPLKVVSRGKNWVEAWNQIWHY